MPEFAQTLQKAQQTVDDKLAELEAQAQALQIQLNTEEAKNPNLFVSGWLPAIGWICAIGFAYIVLIQPMLSWLSSMVKIPLPPVISPDLFLPVLLGMLGLVGSRTYEKVKGVASK